MNPALVGLFLAIGQASPGTLISSSPNGILTQLDMDSRCAKYFPADLPIPKSAGDVRLFRVTYGSTNVSGKPVPLSGLVALPRLGVPKGLVMFCHGTMSYRPDSPSNYTGTPAPNEAEIAVLALATGGYAVAVPDYLGLGIDPSTHPFPLATVNARAVIDMIKPARQLAYQRGFPVRGPLFVTGYSEGGSVAMCVARDLKDTADPDLKLSAAATLSGPYDLTSTMVKYILAETPDLETRAAKFYFTAYMGLSADRNFGSPTLGEMFVPSMATYIPYVWKGDEPTESLIKKLLTKGTQVGAIKSIRRAVQPAMIKALEERDLASPLMKLLLPSDCYDWSPRVPLLIACMATDQIVPAVNSELALSAMRVRGLDASRVQLLRFNRPKMNHITFSPTALSAARAFFDGGFAALPADR